MFTGLIEATGVVESATNQRTGVRLRIRPSPASQDKILPAKLGDSICVNGCCLTVAIEPTDEALTFDAILQTLAMTTLGSWSAGKRVHLEASATPTTLMGGHMVQGHVDCVGNVLRVERTPGWRVRIGVSSEHMALLAPQGSVCVDGVSLTLAHVDVPHEWFEVALIPTTLDKTALGELHEGDRVNIEFDIIAKQVRHALRVHGVIP